MTVSNSRYLVMIWPTSLGCNINGMIFSRSFMFVLNFQLRCTSQRMNYTEATLWRWIFLRGYIMRILASGAICEVDMSEWWRWLVKSFSVPSGSVHWRVHGLKLRAHFLKIRATGTTDGGMDGAWWSETDGAFKTLSGSDAVKLYFQFGVALSPAKGCPDHLLMAAMGCCVYKVTFRHPEACSGGRDFGRV